MCTLEKTPKVLVVLGTHLLPCSTGEMGRKLLGWIGEAAHDMVLIDSFRPARRRGTFMNLNGIQKHWIVVSGKASDPRRGKNGIQAPPKVPEPGGTRRQTLGMDAGSCTVGKPTSSSGRRDGGIARRKTFSVKNATTNQSRWSSGEPADSSNQGQRERQGENCWKFLSCQTRSRKGPEQEEEEGERQLVGLSRRVVKTRHVRESHNRCHFMPVHTKYAQKIDHQGPPPSWHLWEHWRCEVALGPRGGAAEGCSRRRSAALCLPVSFSHRNTEYSSRGWSGHGLCIFLYILQRTPGCA